MRLTQIVTLSLDPRVHRVAQRIAWILKGRLNVPMVAAIAGIAMLIWIVAGFRLRGMQLVLWMLVPLFGFAASICVAGPGRLFDKRAHEGRVVVLLARKDAVTMLDVVGLSLAAAGILLALVLIGWRFNAGRRETAG
jgi:hypothetical protein